MRIKLYIYIAFLSLVMFFGFPTLAYAYIDPATTSYIIQIAAGLVISLSVVFGVFFRKIQIFIITLRARIAAVYIRLTSKKHRELRRLNQFEQKQGKVGSSKFDGENTTRQTAPKTPQSKLAYLFSDTRKFRFRLMLAALVALGLTFTVIFFGGCELFLTNKQDFPYTFEMLIGPLALLWGIAALALIIFLCIFKGRVFNSILSLAFVALLMLYIQGNFLNINFGALAGTEIAWAEYTLDAIINAAVWIIALLIVFILLRFKQKVWTGLVIFIPAALIVMQGVALLSTITQYDSFDDRLEGGKSLTDQAIVQGDYTDLMKQIENSDVTYLSTKGQYEVSAQQNVIVLLIDALDQRYLEAILAQDPNFFAPLDGFTNFTNNMSHHNFTYPSVIEYLTGQTYNWEKPGGAFIKDAWRHGEFLPTIKLAGYTSKIYSERGFVYLDAGDLTRSADNLSTGKRTIKTEPALKHLMKLSLFRYSPLALKPTFYITTGEFTNDSTIDGKYPLYIPDDISYYQGLLATKLSKVDDKGQFTFLHFNGSHPPYHYDENLNIVPTNESSAMIQTKGVFKTIVFEYIRQLKELGVYENATIVITGDHAEHQYSKLESTATTGLFFKPAGSYGSPLSFNSAPVQAPNNFQSSVLEGFSINRSTYSPTYLEVADDTNTQREYLVHTGGNFPQIYRYTITGDANNFSNYRLVDEMPIKYWY